MRTVAILLLTSIGAIAQPAFEVASVRAGQSGRESIEFGPASLTIRNARLSSCIQWAYGVQDVQVSGPSWLSDAWFDIFAKSASEVKVAELREMLQVLLADRFKLAVHRESKEMTALLLTVSKSGHRLQTADKEGSPSFQTGKLKLTGQGATIGQLTDFLSRELRTPVVDQTGLTGRFNYFLDIEPYFTEESQKAAAHSNGGPPPKVESKKVPVEVIVVDRMEKTPTEN